MRTALADTHSAIDALHGEMSYPAIARRLGLERRYWPVLSRIVNGGPVSVAMENDVRRALGMDPIPAMVETPACPDCGEPHVATARCNGRPVTVRLVRQRRPPAPWVREATRNLERLIEAKHGK